ncbi:MAG: hypothetical protein AAB705_03295 [Patescibacteria group bacterium]
MKNNNSKILFRSLFTEKLMDLGNIIATALIFSQFLSEKQFSIKLFTLGLIMAIISYVISYIISE